MNENLLIAIFKQIVADMGHTPGLQINTFGLVDSIPDLAHESLGYSFQDYLNGHFWSRYWVGNGADPERIKADFPALYVEVTDARQICIDDPEFEQRFSILVIDKIKCDDCPTPENRSGRSVAQGAREMLRIVLKELSTYQLWTVDDNGDISDQWISSGRAAYLASLPGYTLTGPTDFLGAAIADTEFSIFEAGTWEDFRAQRTAINFTFCLVPEFEFNYQTPLIDFDAMAIPCVTC